MRRFRRRRALCALAGVLSPTSALVAPGRAPFSSTRPVRMDASALPLVSDYSTALLAHPLETKVATAAVLALAGDAIAQRSTAAPYDRARAASFVLFDAAYRGGFQHAAFPWIIEHCRGEYLEAAAAAAGVSGLDPSLLAAVECTALNQLVVVPIIYYPLFFGVTGAVQGLAATESLARARANFVSLTLRNWKFWIPAQLAQFAFLGEEWQVPYTCVMGLVWNIILSAAAGEARAPPAQVPPAEERFVGKVRPTRAAEERAAVGAREKRE